jgi:uncharacterized protein (DUF58 family)
VTIDPAFLDELGRFDASLKRETTAMRQGEQESPDVGEGLTFSDYRRYVPGDDIRLVDWRVYARTEEYYVKQYEAERNLTVHVLVDASASMDFGGGDADKFDFAAKLGLGFAYLLADEGNEFRVSTFDTDHDRLDGGRSNRGELLRVIDVLNETTPSGAADFEAVMETYAGTIGSRSLVVVASDFLASPDEIEGGLAALGDNEVVLAHVTAPAELEPDVRGDTRFEDPETAAETRTYFGERLARRYRDRLDEHVDEIAARAEALRATHALVDTGSDFFDAFGDVWIE